MAEPITIQKLIEASMDSDSLEVLVNGDETAQVTTRTGETYPSVKKAIKELFVNGGITGRFKTLVELQSSELVDGSYALVADDNDENNGIYIKEGGAWVKSKYDSSLLFNKRAEEFKRALGYWGDDTFITGKYLSNEGEVFNQSNYGMTDFIPVAEETLYEFSAKTSPTTGGHWFDSNKNLIGSFGEGNINPNNGRLPVIFTARSPMGARYLRMTSYVEFGDTGIPVEGKYVRALENVAYHRESEDPRFDGLLEDFKKSFGYWGDEAFIAGEYLRNDGLLLNQANYGMTDFIPVAENTLYEFSAKTSPFAGGHWFDANKDRISSFGEGQNNPTNGEVPVIFTTRSPEGARYLRMTSYVEFGDTGLPIVGKYVRPLENIPMHRPSIDPRLNAMLRSAVTKDDFIFKDAHIAKSDGSLFPYAEYEATDFIPVLGGSKYHSNIRVTTANAIGWYNTDRVFVDYSQGTGEYEVIAPNNARFVRLSYKPSLTDNPVFSGAFPQLSDTALVNTLADKQEKDTDLVEKDVQVEVARQFEDAGLAYPKGRAVYDHSRRTEVYADGVAWRLGDGKAARMKTQVYDFPDWEEFRDALPTYAKEYEKNLDVSTTNKSDWLVIGYQYDLVDYSDRYGDRRVKLTAKSASGYSWVYCSASAVNRVKNTFVFDYYVDMDKLAAMGFGLFASDGTPLYWKEIKNSGDGVINARRHAGHSHVRIDASLAYFGKLVDTATYDDVAYIGFRMKTADGVDEVSAYISNVENVDFKPKITLRWDDQERGVYETAWPMLAAKGMLGLIAVITGAQELDGGYTDTLRPKMTKAELIEMRNAGWDLVSHTRAHIRVKEFDDDAVRYDYQHARDYLKNELGVSPLCYSMLVCPFTYSDYRSISIAREFYDAIQTDTEIVPKVWESMSPQMMRQPHGVLRGAHWCDIRAFKGDNVSSVQQLIDYAEEVIEKQGWGNIYMHMIRSDTGSVYNIKPEILQQFVDWLDTNKSRIEVVTPTQVVKRVRPNDNRI